MIKKLPRGLRVADDRFPSREPPSTNPDINPEPPGIGDFRPVDPRSRGKKRLIV